MKSQSTVKTKRTINDFGIDFLGKRKFAAIVSGTALVICLLSILFRGFDFGLDFTGGTVIELGYQEPVELSEIHQSLESQGFPGTTIQYFGSNRDILIRLAPQEEKDSSKQSDRVFRILSQEAKGQVELRRVEFVGPQVGEELREQGGLAVLFSLIGILIYVALRFEWRFAVGAVVALVHDVLFTVGIFSIFQIQFDLTVLAAVLAVIGYSLNDTIVIFDRIRENFRRMRKGTVMEITNNSINQTLSRTIVTSGTTLLVLFALYLFGGEAISGFSLALIVGIFVGTYSTIYVATAIVIWLGLTKADLLPVPVKKEGAELDSMP
ncbi:protein-export membrane protein SecF [Thiorhodococcus drewsii AZ1]|uniref:Protein-export membrane protein SecF n=1 Tax=Thiorhodococcus drewsii AZ1 TaxID=765913 RepID=G2E2L2_9GAMM|nr:protein translocase subunit SecF [Thiorhodococcus drewsii]EGV30566.1 protein-export membrane protein SecF [Thiorhodococcus drewsii AZ1]